MSHIGSSFFTVSGPPAVVSGWERAPIVVWLWGEHDLSTDSALCLSLARAIALTRVGLVLDLSEVEFIGVTTLGVIVRAQDFLRRRSMWLTVRSPSPVARRAIAVCGLDELLVPGPAEEGEAVPEALGSWVAVPVRERAVVPSGGPAPERCLAPANAATTIDLDPDPDPRTMSAVGPTLPL